MKKLRCATRGSSLALAQYKYVEEVLKKENIECEPIVIKTYGDKNQLDSLNKIGGQGVFIKEVQKAVILGDADFALHSAKDCPIDLPDSTTITAILGREYVEDVIVGKPLSADSELVVGTSSRRRLTQLKSKYPKLIIKDIRGNINTRLEKLDKEYDSLILAKAGLHRLGLDHLIQQVLPVKEFIPQVGQGALLIETRTEDIESQQIMQKINNQELFDCVMQERSFLKVLGAGCSSPCGAYVRYEDQKVVVNALYEDKTIFSTFEKIEGVGETVGLEILGEKE